jgi:hypothetical protein
MQIDGTTVSPMACTAAAVAVARSAVPAPIPPSMICEVYPHGLVPYLLEGH